MLAVLIFALLTTLHTWSQASAGGIAGAARDSAGAVFISAKVQIEPTGRQVATDNHPRQVLGSLQSHYQTPFFNAVWTVARGWGLRGEWNYHDYGEAGRVGPTLPRAFHTNLYTLGIHCKF